METFWDTRYDTVDFIYGKDPNAFFASRLPKLSRGRLLLPGEGEGRNALFAAKLGWKVEAFDQSVVGRSKAMKMMNGEGVRIDYHVCDLTDFQFREDRYDAAGLIFFHAMPQQRRLLHHGVTSSLKKGGVLIMEAFHTSQLGNQTGGPPVAEMLFDKQILLEDFSSLKTVLIEEVTTHLDEGPFHQGEASLIRYVGEKV